MKVMVKTESGSTYLLDDERMTWSRLRERPYEGFYEGWKDTVRTQEGPLNAWPSIMVGEPLNLIGPPLSEGTNVRLISTSPVVEISEINE